jgi:hypothetical protein
MKKQTQTDSTIETRIHIPSGWDALLKMPTERPAGSFSTGELAKQYGLNFQITSRILARRELEGKAKSERALHGGRWRTFWTIKS